MSNEGTPPDNGDPGDPGDRTIFNPQGVPPQSAQPANPYSEPVPPLAPPAPAPIPMAPATSFAPGQQARQIQVGDVLNHIFEVKRFIARGGMGEVFEGINVNSDERVAIKVILQNLAADPNVQAMFRKEARTLTRLGHPALVQYRVLAQEPVLNVFYIVTEYIDGRNLSDVLRDLDPTPAELAALTKRLAEGLSAAHALGAIHRDISPDNVMLEGGRLEGAKIIDFGIAKDLDPGSATIIGDGFAGKLNYVAPEQLGDFGREVGPWSDVYSLGLVILAVAMKRDVSMGATLVDAVDKRRAGPDLSAIPEALRPVIAAMLAPNPADRLRSMGEVVERLDGRGAPPVAAPIAAPATAKEKKPKRVAAASALGDEAAGKSKLPLIGGGIAAVVLLIGVGGYLATRPAAPSAETSAIDAPISSSVAAPADPAAAARGALDSGLSSVGCTWLEVASITPDQGGLAVALRGVAGRPADAQGQIAGLLKNAGVGAANLDFADVSPIEPSECGPLEAFRQIRSTSGNAMTVAQRQFEMVKLIEGDDAGKIGGQAVLNFNLADTAREYSIFGLEPNGNISQITQTTSELAGLSVGPNQYRLTLNVTHPGWSGILLLSGKRPLNAKFVGGPPKSRDDAWTKQFQTAAAQGGWKAEMVWFKTVDNQPN